MAFSLNAFSNLAPAARIAYLFEHEEELQKLTEKQIERVATLLCHASTKEAREKYPIERDLRANKAQETFEKHSLNGVEKAQSQALEVTNGANA